MPEPPPYVVLVEQVDDIEDLLLMAYAAANSVHDGTTEHWDEPRPCGVALHFMDHRAAVVFMAYCVRSGIHYKPE